MFGLYRKYIHYEIKSFSRFEYSCSNSFKISELKSWFSKITVWSYIRRPFLFSFWICQNQKAKKRLYATEVITKSRFCLFVCLSCICFLIFPNTIFTPVAYQLISVTKFWFKFEFFFITKQQKQLQIKLISQNLKFWVGNSFEKVFKIFIKLFIKLIFFRIRECVTYGGRHFVIIYSFSLVFLLENLMCENMWRCQLIYKLLHKTIILIIRSLFCSVDKRLWLQNVSIANRTCRVNTATPLLNSFIVLL